jgi:hypothetical protein
MMSRFIHTTTPSSLQSPPSVYIQTYAQIRLISSWIDRLRTEFHKAPQQSLQFARMKSLNNDLGIEHGSLIQSYGTFGPNPETSEGTQYVEPSGVEETALTARTYLIHLHTHTNKH